jgi:PKD repeat protein
MGAGLAMSTGALTDVTVVGSQGPSTAFTPYVVPTAAGVRTVSILTVGETVNPKLDGATPYRMLGLPDGMGAFDNGDGTFTMLSNHEIGSGSGTTRAHGGIGATVSSWKIDKSSLAVISGGDLIRTVMLWDYVNQKWIPSATATFNRLCSADLAEPSAFFNPATGKGTRERIFFSGEESSGGRAFAHIATGGNAGVTYELPRLGRDAWENTLACPFAQDITLVVGQDDTSSPGGQVYVYVGTKQATGNEVQRAGLANGTLYAVVANAIRNEDRTTGIGTAKGQAAPFTLVSLGDNSVSPAPNTETLADTAGATEFLRPEDGAWDPANPTDYWFVTTDRFDQTKNATGATVGRSRLWRMRFTDLAQPQLGGTIAVLLDGTEPHNMFDNMCMTANGHIMLQEDVGGQSWNGRIWRYDVATSALTEIARHDAARFGSETQAATAPFTNDEEASGIIDASHLLGAGWFLLNDQAHYSAGDAELVEGGQFLALFDPACATVPEITAAATANPGEAVVGQAVSFRVGASQSGGGVLTYAWDFGDGTNGAGPNPSHAYANAGSYTATCTVTHGATNLTAQSTVDVHVSRPALATSVAITLNFAKPNKDSLTLKGEYPVPAGFSPAGRQVVVDVAGVTRTFTLDANGKGSVSDGTFSLVLRKARGAVVAQRGKFTMTLKNTSLQTQLAAAGLTNADSTGILVDLPVETTFAGTTYDSVADVVYTAKAGKTGVAK